MAYLCQLKRIKLDIFKDKNMKVWWYILMEKENNDEYEIDVILFQIRFSLQTFYPVDKGLEF